MAKKLKAVLADKGFYGALSVCLLAAAVGGYFLLPDSDAPAAEPLQEVAADVPMEVETPPKEISTVNDETYSPDPVDEAPTAAVMPEIDPPVVDDTPVVAVAPTLVVQPLRGEVVAAFSVDHLIYSETLEDWRIHDGLDISASAGTAVLAASVGTVQTVTDDALMGTTVIIDHGDGYQTTYANLQTKPPVEKGQRVTAGQVIGAVGTTAAAESAQGPHLHFSVSHDGDLVDPNVYLKR